MEVELEKLTEVELKAIAYDTLAQLQTLQNQLNIINGELTKRVQAKQQTPVLIPTDIVN